MDFPFRLTPYFYKKSLNMKSFLLPLVLLCIVLAFYGCPYSTAVAIDDTPQVKIDDHLLGTWNNANFPKDSGQAIFSRKSDKEYNLNIIINISDTSTDYDYHNMTAFISKVGKQTVLNAWDPGEQAYY